MTSPRFEFTTHPAEAEVHVRLWDYWTDEEATAYRGAMAQAVSQMASCKSWVGLIDISRSPPQSPAVQRMRQEILEHAKTGGMRRIAYIVQSDLTQQQMSRLNGNAGTDAAFFHQRAEALQWLHQKP